MATAQPNNVIISYPSSGTVVRKVTIATTKVTENWTKTLTPIPLIKSTDELDVDDASTYTGRVVQLLRKPEKRWTVVGHIQSELGTASPENTYANEKRDDLKAIFIVGKNFKFTDLEGTDHIVNSDKFEIVWDRDDQDPVEIYSVTFTVVETTE